MWGSGSVSDRRNATAIVFGFFFGCRAAELSMLEFRDVSVLSDGTVRATFRHRKNRQTTLGTHEPQVIHAKHALLTEAIS